MMPWARARFSVAAGFVLASVVAVTHQAAAATYVETGVVKVPADRGLILGFCVAHGGGMVGVTGVKHDYGAATRRAAAGKRPAHRVVWFDADGVERRSVELDFAATVVAAAPGGGVYVAGDGVVALLTAEGEEVVRGTTPQAAKTDEERAEIERAVVARRDMELRQHEQQIERVRNSLDELKAKVKEADRAIADADEEDSEESGDGEDAEERRKLRESRQRRLRSAQKRVQMQASRMAGQLRSMEAQAEVVRRQDPASLVEQVLRKTRQVLAISAVPDAVFIVVAESSGYGYAVWRLDQRLENPACILSKLVGCCGQMDVQVVGGRLAVAANRKHCVDLCSFDGQTLGTVGARAAAGDDGAGFGGCCNPMNVCEAPNGGLFTSESIGVVKRFDAEGKFVEVVGKVGVKAGCKNSAIAIEPDGSRLYYMDSATGQVLVLTRSPDSDDEKAALKADR